MATKANKVTLTNEEKLEHARMTTKVIALTDLFWCCMGLLVSVGHCISSFSLLYVPPKDLTRNDILFGLLPWYATSVFTILCKADRLLDLATHKEICILSARKWTMLWIFVGAFSFFVAIFAILVIGYVTHDMHYTQKLIFGFLIVLTWRLLCTAHVCKYVMALDKSIAERNLQKQRPSHTKIIQNGNIELGTKGGLQNV